MKPIVAFGLGNSCPGQMQSQEAAGASQGGRKLWTGTGHAEPKGKVAKCFQKSSECSYLLIQIIATNYTEWGDEQILKRSSVCFNHADIRVILNDLWFCFNYKSNTTALQKLGETKKIFLYHEPTNTIIIHLCLLSEIFYHRLMYFIIIIMVYIQLHVGLFNL